MTVNEICFGGPADNREVHESEPSTSLRNTNQDPQNVSKDTAALTWPVLSFILILSMTKLIGLNRVLLEKLAVAQLDNKTLRISHSPKICRCSQDLASGKDPEPDESPLYQPT